MIVTKEIREYFKKKLTFNLDFLAVFFFTRKGEKYILDSEQQEKGV